MLGEYAQHVWRHWWSVVVGAAGGVLFLVSLFVSISIPTWLGASILVVGLSIAQSLAFKDMRQERNEARRANEFSIGPSPFPRTKLESAVVKSLVAARDIERESAVRGQQDLSDRLIAWAGETDQRLDEAGAGELHARFRHDGLHPPHGTSEAIAYLSRQITLMEDALRQLRSDEASSNGG
jgi:hypothetical protein